MAEFEAGNFTAAAFKLERLSGNSKDPRVFKYLAMSLHRTNRPEEAKRALNAYRRLASDMPLTAPEPVQNPPRIPQE